MMTEVLKEEEVSVITNLLPSSATAMLAATSSVAWSASSSSTRLPSTPSMALTASVAASLADTMRQEAAKIVPTSATASEASFPAALVPEEDLGLSCGVCFTAYDTGLRRPLILPECGHSFCRLCLKDVIATTGLICPSCRRDYGVREVDTLAINFSLQCLVVSGPNMKNKVESLIEEDPGSACPEHDLRLSFWCQSCEEAACGECLYERHPRPDHNITKLGQVMSKIREMAKNLSTESGEEVGRLVGACVARALHSVSDLQEASHLLLEVGSVKSSALAAHDLAAITSVLESAKSLRDRMAALPTASINTSSVSSTGPMSFATRLNVMALNGDGRVARVTVEDKGVHVYSLDTTSKPFSVAIMLKLLIGCVSKEAPLAFLDVAAGQRPLGRVYIQLQGGMRRSQHFMCLCLGTFNKCYKGTRFDGLNDPGLPGEFLRGGDYTGRGGLGGESLMDNLEWDGEFVCAKEAGQLCGVGGEQGRRFGALFGICLKSNPKDTFRCPFGRVVEGLGVLEVAVRHTPFNVVHISDCGVVVPL